MKKGSWQRLREFFKVERVSPRDAALTVGLSVNELRHLAQEERLSKSVLTKLEQKYGLRKEYVLNGAGPITIAAEEPPHSRIVRIRKELGLTQTEFAKGCGLTQSGISGVELGEIPLRRMMALAIEAAYSVRHQWLLFGQGPRDVPARLMADEKHLLDRYRATNPDMQRVLLHLLDSIVSSAPPWDGILNRRRGDRRSP